MKDYHYLKLHFGVLKMKELKLSSRVIYSFLSYLSVVNETISVTNGFIAKKLGLSIDTVKRSLLELRQKELIQVTNSNRFRTIEVVKLDFYEYVTSHFDALYPNMVETEEVKQALQRLYDRVWYLIIYGDDVILKM